MRDYRGLSTDDLIDSRVATEAQAASSVAASFTLMVIDAEITNRLGSNRSPALHANLNIAERQGRAADLARAIATAEFIGPIYDPPCPEPRWDHDDVEAEWRRRPRFLIDQTRL